MMVISVKILLIMMMIRPRVRAPHLPSHMFFSRALSQGKQTSIKKKAITGLHKVSTQRQIPMIKGIQILKIMLFHKLSHKSNNSRSSLSSGVLCFRYKISLQNKCHCDCVSAGYMCICIFCFCICILCMLYICVRKLIRIKATDGQASRELFTLLLLFPQCPFDLFG